MKINKRDLILQSIIESYLQDNTPIGSTQLMVKMNECIPASTIRVYFKKLSDEGAIEQLHISSGRIPTVSTMVSYWKERLYFDKKIVLSDRDELDFILSNFDIYCMIFISDNELLKEVINYRDRYILLIFDEDEIMLKFDGRIFKFLSNLVGVELKRLEEISAQVGLSELRVKIKELKRSKIQFISNEIIAYKIFNDERFKHLLDPNFANKFVKDLVFSPVFDDGFMGIKKEIVFEDKEATMLCAGSVYEDYEKFFNILMEAA